MSFYRLGVSARYAAENQNRVTIASRFNDSPVVYPVTCRLLLTPPIPLSTLCLSLPPESPALCRFTLPRFSSVASSSAATTTPRASRFLNPHRFRPCPLEFESTLQNRGVTKRSYVSLLPRRATKGFAFAFLLYRVSTTRANRSTGKNARAARWSEFSEPLPTATCSSSLCCVTFLPLLRQLRARPRPLLLALFQETISLRN